MVFGKVEGILLIGVSFSRKIEVVDGLVLGCLVLVDKIF